MTLRWYSRAPAASDAARDLKRAAASPAEVNAAGQDERRTLHAEKEELLRIQRGLMLELQTEQDGSDAARDELAAANIERGRLKVAEERAGELQALLASQSSELKEARDMASGRKLEVEERDKMYSIRGDWASRQSTAHSYELLWPSRRKITHGS